MHSRGNIPHQNRLEFLAPPFVSRQKVEENHIETKKIDKYNFSNSYRVILCWLWAYVAVDCLGLMREWAV
jgi:hypothetical protein